MPYRILFVAALHHPDQLRAAQHTAAANGEPLPLFPPSMAQHHWARELLARGHTLDVFYRNQPLFGTIRAEHHTQRITPAKLAGAVMRRVPVAANPDLQVRNRRLIDHARRFQPDVLWVMGDNTVITGETLAAVQRETGCTLVYASGTSPIVFSHAIERAAARLYDLVLVSDFYHGIQWRELGAKRAEVLPLSGCLPEFHRPYPLTDAERAAYACEVGFVGTLIPDHLYGKRVAALEALRDFDLAIWSVHDLPPSLKPYQRQTVGGVPPLGAEALKIMGAAKLTINTHGDFVFWGGNLRLYEAAGCGVVQIADDLPGVREWFTPGETIRTYRDHDDLRAQVAYLLAHEDERLALAQRARAHVYAQHTYAQRMARAEALIAEVRG